MAALNFDPAAYVANEWLNRENLDPDTLYSHVWHRLPGWREYGDILYRRLHGDYNWTSQGVDWKLSDDSIRSVLYKDFQDALTAADTGIGVHAWLDDLFNKAYEKLYDPDLAPKPTVSNQSNDEDLGHEITAFSIAGYLVKAVRNLAIDDLRSRGITPGVRSPQVNVDDAWKLYVRAGASKAAVKKWWKRRFVKGSPHPLLESAKEHFIKTGSIREIDRLVSVAFNGSTYKPRRYRFKVGEAEMSDWGPSDILVQIEIDRRGITAARHSSKNPASITLHPSVAHDVCKLIDLRHSLDALSIEEYATINAYYFEGKKDRTAAEAAGVKTDTFRKRRNRAVEELAHVYRARRNPRQEAMLLLADLNYHAYEPYIDYLRALGRFLATLSPREFNRLLHWHTDGLSTVEFNHAHYEQFTDAHSLVSERPAKNVFTDPKDPWSLEKSPLYVRPTEPCHKSIPKPRLQPSEDTYRAERANKRRVKLALVDRDIARLDFLHKCGSISDGVKLRATRKLVAIRCEPSEELLRIEGGLITTEFACPMALIFTADTSEARKTHATSKPQYSREKMSIGFGRKTLAAAEDRGFRTMPAGPTLGPNKSLLDYLIKQDADYYLGKSVECIKRDFNQADTIDEPYWRWALEFGAEKRRLNNLQRTSKKSHAMPSSLPRGWLSASTSQSRPIYANQAGASAESVPISSPQFPPGTYPDPTQQQAMKAPKMLAARPIGHGDADSCAT